MKLKFHRRGAAKNLHRNAHPAALIINFFDHPVKVIKRAFIDTNDFTHIKQYFGTRLLYTFLDTIKN